MRMVWQQRATPSYPLAWTLLPAMPQGPADPGGTTPASATPMEPAEMRMRVRLTYAAVDGWIDEPLEDDVDGRRRWIPPGWEELRDIPPWTLTPPPP